MKVTLEVTLKPLPVPKEFPIEHGGPQSLTVPLSELGKADILKLVDELREDLLKARGIR